MLKYEKWNRRTGACVRSVRVYGVDNPAELCYLALYALQHRGQQGAGIAVSDGQGITYIKDNGLLNEVFQDNSVFKSLSGGTAGIGHVRYSTAGELHASNTQPFVVAHRTGRIASRTTAGF